MLQKNGALIMEEKFWDQKAKVFPRYDPGEITYESRTLDIIKEAGVDFRGKKVLDVGCGSGMYTIRIAQMADKVTALDFSGEMLNIMKSDADKIGVKNINYVHKDFLSYEVEDNFDIVFCSMSPAVGCEQGKEKLLNIKGATSVFIGSTGPMRSDIMEGIYARHELNPAPFLTAVTMRNFLEIQGVRYKKVPLEGVWKVKFTKEDMLFSICGSLERFGVKPEMDYLSKYLEQFLTDEGRYLETTEYWLEIIIWKNPV
jgi:SAM-dependent methyltransferase